LDEPTCDVERVTEVALMLLREYAPARPVRLLGVRVAGLADVDTGSPEEPGDAAGYSIAGARLESEDQLALPV
jgi:DNA polymerase-4